MAHWSRESCTIWDLALQPKWSLCTCTCVCMCGYACCSGFKSCLIHGFDMQNRASCGVYLKSSPKPFSPRYRGMVQTRLKNLQGEYIYAVIMTPGHTTDHAQCHSSHSESQTHRNLHQQGAAMDSSPRVHFNSLKWLPLLLFLSFIRSHYFNMSIVRSV